MQIKSLHIKSYRSWAIADTASEAAIARIKKLEPYAEQVLEILEQSNLFENCASQFSPRPKERPLTKFERRGQKLGHKIWGIVMRKAG